MDAQLALKKQDVSPVTAGTSLDSWLTPGRFAAILGILLVATFPDVITGQATFFFRDFGVFTYPTAYFHRQSFWRGEVPLWNPLNNCGIPFLAQWNTASLYPPSLFYLLLPLSWSLGVFCVGHLFLAGMGMYFLAHRWTGNRFAAAVAGVAFAYNGLSWYLMTWISNLAVYAWMPWVVLSVQRAWREGGRHIVLAGLAGAVQMLGGAPELILQTWLFIGFLWLQEFCEAGVHRRKMLVRPLGVGILVATLSAAQLLPFLDLLAHSQRSAGFGDADWSMPISGIGNFLVPLFHCIVTGHGVFVQQEQYWTPSYYVGIGIVALALLAVLKMRERRVWLLLAAAVFSILLSLGPVFTTLKTLVPQLGFMRYPIKFVVLAIFALPLLSAYAVKWIQSSFPVAKRPLPSVVAVALVLLGLISWITWLAKYHSIVGDDPAMTLRNAATRAALLAVILLVLVFLQRARSLKKQLVLSGAFLVLLWMDVYTHASNLTPTVPLRVYQPELMRTELKLDPKPQTDEFRVMPTLATANKIRFTSLSDPSADYLCRRVSFFDDCNLLDEIPSIDGFYSLFLPDPDHVSMLLMKADSKSSNVEGLKDFLGVRYINSLTTNAEKFAEWVPRESALPLIIGGQRPVFADGTNVLRSLMQSDFNPREVIFLPTALKSQISATNATKVKLTTHQASAKRLEFDVEAEAPALVSVAQTFYHPWHAYVDGKPVALWKANFAFQALEVPVGKHSVRLQYEDKGFQLGALISLVALLGSGVACLYFGRHQTTSELAT